MKKLLTVLTVATVASVLTGCATASRTTVTNKSGLVISQEKQRTDPLLSKSVEDDSILYGLDFNFLGSSSLSPFHVKLGIARTVYRSIPTATNTVYSAAYNKTGHLNASLIQQSGDENVSTTEPLPVQAFVGPNVQTLNPIVQSPSSASVASPTKSPVATPAP